MFPVPSTAFITAGSRANINRNGNGTLSTHCRIGNGHYLLYRFPGKRI
jgi:hypothetical protein